MFSENIINLTCCIIIKMPAFRVDKFSAGRTKCRSPMFLWSIYKDKEYLNHTLGLTLSTPGLVKLYFPTASKYILLKNAFYSIKRFPWAEDYRVFYLQFILKIILYSVKSGLMLDILQEESSKLTANVSPSILPECYSHFIFPG